jgi:hypothetical protein
MSDDDRPRRATPANASGADAKPAPPERDMVFVHSRSADGAGFQVLRSRSGHVELGELRGLRQGQAIAGEVVRLQATEEHTNLFEVETLLEAPAAARALSGPAQVSSDAYRRQWEAIFGDDDEPEPNELN